MNYIMGRLMMLYRPNYLDCDNIINTSTKDMMMTTMLREKVEA